MVLRKHGFTVIELLIVIAIIALLSFIVAASLQSLKEKNRITTATLFDYGVQTKYGADMVGEWTFDNDTGTTVRDTSYVHQSGTLVGNAQLITTGCIIGACLQTTNTGYVTVPSYNEANFGTDDFAISFWVKMTPPLKPAEHTAFVQKTPSASRGYNVQALYDGTNTKILAGGFFYADSGVGGNYAATKPNLYDNRWHHILASIIRDDSAVTPAHAASMRLYIDGIEDHPTAPIIMPLSETTNNNAPIQIGYNAYGGPAFTMLMDDVRLFRGTVRP